MKIFEEMKAALAAQAPLVDRPEPDSSLPFKPIEARLDQSSREHIPADKPDTLPSDKLSGPPKTVTKVTKAIEENPESSNQGGFVNIVTVSEGSQNLTIGDSRPCPMDAASIDKPDAESGKRCPFWIRQTVFYKIPINITSAGRYDWEWHQGTISAINHHLEMVTLFPNNEGGEWRIHPWRYTQEARPDALV